MKVTQNGMLSSGSPDGSFPFSTPNTFSDTSSAGPKVIEPMDTESGSPASSESALAIAPSISLTDEPLSAAGVVNEGNAKVIGIAPERVCELFDLLALVFPLNVDFEHQCRVSEASEVYASLLSDIPADECEKAFAACAKTLTRFPYPSDVRAAAGR